MKYAVTAAILSTSILASPALAAATKVVATIDYSKGETVASQIENLGGALSAAGELIHLSLKIVPGGTEDKPDYRVTRTSAKTGKSADLRCDNGWERLTGATSEFSFNFNPDYNHLQLAVKNLPATAAPFNTVACEYNTGVAPIFTITGYFAKSEIGVPTTYDFELRPVTPAMAP